MSSVQTLYTETESESPSAVARKRVSRLSMRRGRSVVHKNLEDNYGAVISANHEALAQILEQVKFEHLHCRGHLTKQYYLSGLSKPPDP